MPGRSTHSTRYTTGPTPPIVVATDRGHELDGLDEAGGFQIGDRRGLQSAEVEAVDLDLDTMTTAELDTGDLYGVQTQQAVDTDLTAPEDEDGFKGADRGENWIEALSASATENGVLPEREVDVEDELDQPGASHTHKDVPVADAGSGGPGGE